MQHTATPSSQLSVQDIHADRKHELKIAAIEVAALFGIFLVAFFGRSHFSDGVKQILIVLSVLVGAAGMIAGLATIRRALPYQEARFARVGVGLFMAFIGIYTIIHVLSS